MLIETLKENLLAARKARTDSIKIDLLTTLYSEASQKGIDDGKRLATDAEVLAAVKKFLKGVDECIAVESSHKLRAEREILLSYLPKQLTAEELSTIIAEHKASIVASGKACSKGDIMKHLNATYQDQFNGKQASGLIDSALKG